MRRWKLVGREGRKEEDATRTRGGEEEGFWVEVEERKGKAAQGGGVVGVRYRGVGEKSEHRLPGNVRRESECRPPE